MPAQTEGTAVRRLIRINLLPHELIKKEDRGELALIGYAAILVFIVISVLKMIALERSITIVEKRIDGINRQMAKYEEIVRQVEAQSAVKATLEMRRAIILSLMASGQIYPRYLEQIAGLIPPGIGFKNMTTRPNGDLMPVMIEADASDTYAIADFLSALGRHGLFNDVELGSITSSASRSGQASFSVSSTYLCSPGEKKK